ncbi:MAG: trimeric intracellular cation channel family protein [Rhodothermales bacterium]|nr:trimeric intracellular cation channel family protein [Rhodothermales bacterium]MBO6781513.1 trimeric intracellular cation channel family protein [Rhodothermales bacterium]
MDLLYLVDIAGTVVFAASGALQANRHQLDFLGFMVLATATGVGGGIIRDMMLGATPPAVFQDELYLIVCVVTGAIVFRSAPPLARRWNRVLVADAIGLGVFAAIGAAKGHVFGLGPIGIMMMAALTATGGGVVRDLLVREVPAVIKGGFYATAALLGGLVYWALAGIEIIEPMRVLLTAGTTTGLRFWAMARNISLPTAPELSE